MGWLNFYFFWFFFKKKNNNFNCFHFVLFCRCRIATWFVACDRWLAIDGTDRRAERCGGDRGGGRRVCGARSHGSRAQRASRVAPRRCRYHYHHRHYYHHYDNDHAAVGGDVSVARRCRLCARTCLVRAHTTCCCHCCTVVTARRHAA